MMFVLTISSEIRRMSHTGIRIIASDASHAREQESHAIAERDLGCVGLGLVERALWQYNRADAADLGFCSLDDTNEVLLRIEAGGRLVFEEAERAGVDDGVG